MAGNTCMRAVLAGLLAGMLSIISIPARAAQDVVLLLDNSGSMRLHDPQRLAPRAVLDFVDSRGPDTRIAIIDFATRPMVLMPLTPVSAASRAQVREVLKHLDYHGQRTDTAAALERALYELATDGRAGTQKYIILMTDGFVDVGSAVHNQEKMHWIIQSLIPEAVSDHVRIFGIAFSDEADFELLQTLAEKTGAVYFRAFQDRDLTGVFQRISAALVNAKLMPLLPASGAASPPPPSGSVQPLQFNTPLTSPAPPTSATVHTGWLWAVALLVLVAAGIGLYLARNRRTVKAPRKFFTSETQLYEGPQAALYDISNPNDIKRYELAELSTMIGRVAGYDPEVQYVLVDERTVGRCHAVIERRGHSFWITDQGSINGTFVNGGRVTADRALKHGDIIAVHRHEFEFVIPELFESEATVLGTREKVDDYVEESEV